MRWVPLIICLSILSGPCIGSIYHVSNTGMDANPGTTDSPFRTLTKAVSVLKPGDTCMVMPGLYRESIVLECSGTPDAPINIIGSVDENGQPLAIIDGTDPVSRKWKPVTVNGIQAYSVELDKETVQVFFGNDLMTEARWPDQPFERIWDRSTWARGGEGGYKGRMVSSDIADTGIDWTGASAVLNVGHQFKTWVRKVEAHSAGSPTFDYRLDERMGNDKEDGPTWWDDRFYLFGKVECLTSPGEWFYDADHQQLLFYPPDGTKPEPGEVSVKVRDYGMSGDRVNHITIEGIKFRACTFDFKDSDHLEITNCHVLYPNYSRMLHDTQSPELKEQEIQTSISGNHNLLSKLWIAYGNTAGIRLLGMHNVIENSIIHDVCWDGNISHPAVLLNSLNGTDCSSRVSRCTIYNTGNVGIRYGRRNNIIEYNHVYNTGLACRDIAAIHTGSPDAFGSVARFNWVHDSMGKGIRGDDQTRGLTFHHNVIWNCDEGMILKGDYNKCYNNTIIGTDGHGCLIIPTRPEPQKWWARHEFLDVQNMHSVFCNNLVEAVVYRHDPIPDNPDISNNIELAGRAVLEILLEAFAQRNFSSVELSQARDAGRRIEGVQMEFTGTAPDVGAYESGGRSWTAGADWNPPSLGINLVINAEVARSWDLQLPSGNGNPVPIPRNLRESGLSADSKNKLQALYNECWTSVELKDRRNSIQQRNRLDPGTAAFDKYDKQVADLHRRAIERLKDRVDEVLAGDELKRFREIMK